MNLEDPNTRALIKDVARESAQEAVRGTLTALGIDPAEPLEVQRDMAYLRGMRIATTSIRNHGILAGITICVTGILAALWMGILTYFRGS